MSVFDEATIGNELYYYWKPSPEHKKLYRKVKKISKTQYEELEGPEKGITKELTEFPLSCIWVNEKPASGGRKRTNRRIKKNNKSRKAKSIKNRRK
jgi:hypothetical protein